MRKTILFPFFALMAACSMLTLGSSCGGSSEGGDSTGDSVGQSVLDENADIPMVQITVGSKTYNAADINDAMAVYREDANAQNCFIVISKKEYRLYVYECVGGDTLLAAHFPVCYARYSEPKEGSGDMKTPECTMEKPFTISEIKDASTWCHDFGDGRGSILSYGAWFMRLVTGFDGIGIHGSTNNVQSVPGRDSEGCIRLRDADLIVLHDKFAHVGMNVIIKGYKDGKLPFEKKAEEALGGAYKAATPGNPFANGQGDNAAVSADAASANASVPAGAEEDLEALTEEELRARAARTSGQGGVGESASAN